MLHGKPPVSARYMIKPRCLIRGDGGTGSFPADFVELEKWFRQPQRRVGLPDDRISPRRTTGVVEPALRRPTQRKENLHRRTARAVGRLNQVGGSTRPAAVSRINSRSALGTEPAACTANNWRTVCYHFATQLRTTERDKRGWRVHKDAKKPNK